MACRHLAPPTQQKYDIARQAGVTLGLAKQWSQQSLRGNLSFTDYNYHHYEGLNRSEYRTSLGWEGQLGSAWNGALGISRNRSLPPLTDLAQTSTAPRTEQRIEGKLGVRVGRSWRLEAAGSRLNIRQPLVNAPRLDLTEKPAILAARIRPAAPTQRRHPRQYHQG